MPLPHLPLLLSLPLLSLPALADHRLDLTRMGAAYTGLPLYRSGAGTNVLQIGVGTPEVVVNLTASTNVEFMLVTTDECDDCTEDSATYSIEDSSSVSTIQQALIHTFIYPIGSTNTLSLGGELASEILSDERQDVDTTRPLALISDVQEDDEEGRLRGAAVELSDGTSGFWGMGVFQDNKNRSMMPNMILVDGNGAPSQEVSFTVGFDIANRSTSDTETAGTVHWGGVPNGSWTGDFNWIEANRSVAGSWGFGLDRMRVEDEVIDLSGDYYASIDPAFDAIYLPTSLAEQFFSKVPDASRDSSDRTRWNIPCDTNISLTLTISDTTYGIASSQLVQTRGAATGRSCWSSVVAWGNGSVPETIGEVRLGTPFMSNVYSVLYYTDGAQYIGLAGKPNSINAQNLASSNSGSHPNMKLAGILIGVFLGLLLLLVCICYARNRNSFQSMWYRGIRRQQRATMNAMVRGATLPPPMMGPVGPMAHVGPPMGVGVGMMPGMGVGMGPGMAAGMGPMGPMGPMPMGGPPGSHMGMGMGMGMGMPPNANPALYRSVPPPYQQPLPSQPPPASNQNPQSQPLLLAHARDEMDRERDQEKYQDMADRDRQQQGYYSPGLVETSPPTSAGRMRSPAPAPAPNPPRASLIAKSGSQRSLRPKRDSGGMGYGAAPLPGSGNSGNRRASGRVARTASEMSVGKTWDEFGNGAAAGHGDSGAGGFAARNGFRHSRQPSQTRPRETYDEPQRQSPPRSQLQSPPRSQQHQNQNYAAFPGSSPIPGEDHISPGQLHAPHHA
ncbi:hypothetical protein L198_06230 [Cryptococcus wingfieldii CBS 7118]|uniref:Peptidase A1 domain-containing protein n=1 Tax=Cryptococcus wingfieldii CBS 7118 TaxID=1295528 RepID=A0A1E3INP4_9TREE|nr:hypothetical protein L198_06230 [Cryptococcus wingfieldii CBS 7118]ODN90212.1 hypothetical protein L198_06230 [Cryptococcus wingfieldii CBS 7118]